MTALEALSRTLLLMRQNLVDDVSNAQLRVALQSTRVLLAADRENVSGMEGQEAFIGSALLIARSGIPVAVDAPNVRLKQIRAPLKEKRLVDCLIEAGQDLVPGCTISAVDSCATADLGILLGDTASPLSCKRLLPISGGSWHGSIGEASRWTGSRSPMGALAAAGLAAAEAYKTAMRRLAEWAAPGPYSDFFRPTDLTTVTFLPAGTRALPVEMGGIDFVSGGAITQAALYAMSRIPGAMAQARVIEPDTHDLSNVNRYALLRRSGVGSVKAYHLADQELGTIEIEPVVRRYDSSFEREVGLLRNAVLVGVDNLESRWQVGEDSNGWVGVGATEGYQAFTTVHSGANPCVRCVHDGEPADPATAIPTVSFVSHWAGLTLANAFIRSRLGLPIPPREQVTQINCLQVGADFGVLRMLGTVRPNCHCSRKRSA